MKKILLLTYLLAAANIRLYAQVTYTLDTTSFSGITLEGGMTQARFTDIDQDGHLDLVTIGDHGSPNLSATEYGITVFFGNGTSAGWTLFQNGNFGYGGCAAGDLNNDGNYDLAYSMHHNFGTGDFGDQLIEAALGDGTGMNWTPWDDFLAVNGENYGMFGTDVGDVNNDGLLDIGSNSFGLPTNPIPGAGGVHIYKNLGTGSWQQTFTAGNNGTTGHYIQFGDINHDGNLDFVISNQFGSPYFGDGAGNFTPHQVNNLPALANQDNYSDVSLGDIDNDGDDDFAFTYNQGIYVFKWNDALQQWDNYSSGLPLPGSDYYYVSRLADMDMDGYLDLLTVTAGSIGMCTYMGTVQIWKGNGGNSWVNILTDSVYQMASAVDMAIDDPDHNGYPDAAVWANQCLGGFIFCNYINRIKFFKENHVPTEVNITPLYPKGFECFPNNAARFIHWIAAVPSNHASGVKIELSTTGNAGPWTLVEAAAPNNGTYQWTVPPAVISINCFFRFTLTDSITGGTIMAANPNPFDIGTCNLATGIASARSVNTLTASPNPFITYTNLFSTLKNCSVRIMDVTGKTVREIFGVNKFPLTVERGNLSAGIYVLELRDESGNKERMKLVAE